MITSFEGIAPRIADTAYIAATALVIGDVTIGEHASIWPGAVLRGDTAPISVGAYSNIQDNCVVHGDSGTTVSIGERVTIGHNVVMHGAIVGDNCLIGISATILGKAAIGVSCMIAAGAVVKEGEIIPEGTFWLGVPARYKSPVNYDLIDPIWPRAEHYRQLAERHRASERAPGATSASR